MELIQSVVRSLEVLRQLNLHNGATVYDMCRHVDLPRGTVYRMLETLCEAGYARWDPQTTGYWVTECALSLGAGYEDQSWILEAGPRVIEDLHPQFPCCLALSTPDETDMMIRVSTKRRNPAASDKTIAGLRESMADNVDGHVYLAFASPERRRALLAQIYHQQGLAKPTRDRTKHDGVRINTISSSLSAAVKEFDRIRQRGFSTQIKGSAAGATAVPILRNGVVVGTLKIWYWLSVVKEPQLSKRYIPLLLAAAQKLSKYSASDRVEHSTGLSA